MESNTHSANPADGRPPTRAPDGLGADLGELAAALDGLVAQDLEGLPDAVQAEYLQELGRLLDLLEVQWLRELAELDARGAAGAEQGTKAPSTASWLQDQLGMSAAEANRHVQTARALFGGPARQRPPP